MLYQVTKFARELCERLDGTFTVITYSGKGQCETSHSDTGLPNFRNFRGNTDFNEAFKALSAVVESATSDVVYLFLTDGQHNCSRGIDAVSDTLVTRTLLKAAIEQHRANGFTVTGNALVLTHSADVVIAHALVTEGGDLVCRSNARSLDDLYERFGTGSAQIFDISVILGGQPVYMDQVAFVRNESQQYRATVDVCLPPELAQANDYVIEIDGDRQVVDVTPAAFSLDDVGALWKEIKELPVSQQITRMIAASQQFGDWLLVARRQYADVVQDILGAQTLSATARQDRVVGLLSRLKNVSKLVAKLTFRGVGFKLRNKGDVWDDARAQVSDAMLEHKQAAVAFKIVVDQAIADFGSAQASNTKVSIPVLQQHATQAYSGSQDAKRQARRVKRRLDKLAQAMQNAELFETAMLILRNEGGIPDGHRAEMFECVVSFMSPNEAPLGLALGVKRTDTAFDDPTMVSVKVGGFMSYETFFTIAGTAMTAGQSNDQPMYEADGIGQIGGILPLALFDKHWKAVELGFFSQAIGMSVAGDAYGFKAHMAPVLYGKALLAIWQGIRSEVAVDRLFAVVDTMRRLPAPTGGFGQALDDFASHRFADETGVNLDALVGWAVAATWDSRDDFVQFLGLVWSEMIRRGTRYLDDDRRVAMVWNIRQDLIDRNALTFPVLCEQDALAVFGADQGAGPSARPVPQAIVDSAKQIRSALALYDALSVADLSDMDYEYGTAPEATCKAFFESWTSMDDEFDPLDWAHDTFGVCRRAPLWPWLQRNAASTSQARAHKDALATIYSATDALIDKAHTDAIEQRARKKISLTQVARLMLETDNQLAFACYCWKYVNSDNPTVAPTSQVLAAFKTGDKQPVWKLRILLKGVMPHQRDVNDVSLSGQKGTRYSDLGPRIVPTRGQRKMIKRVVDKDPDRAMSKQAWRRLFNIRKGVPT